MSNMLICLKLKHIEQQQKTFLLHPEACLMGNENEKERT